jgi:hypothetical protein
VYTAIAKHQAVTVCRVFAHQDIIKHIVTGGFWYDNDASKWVQGGAQILGYLDKHSEQARLLGLLVFNRNAPIPGKFVSFFATKTFA